MGWKNTVRRTTAILAVAVVTAAAVWMLPANVAESIGAAGKVHAESTAKSISLVTPTSTGDISDPGSGEWDYVYFGTYDSEPMKFRVLSKCSSFYGDSKTLLLDCDTILDTQPFGDSCNTWSVSSVRDWLNGDSFYNNDNVFSATERSAIAASIQTEMPSGFEQPTTFRFGFVKLNGEHVFLLDASDVNGQYGYNSEADRMKTGGNDYWWLRNPHLYDCICIATVCPGGTVGNFMHIEKYGVSPALNVDLSRILFVSDAGSAKPASLSVPGIASVNDNDTHDWKLTLLDSGQSVKPGRIKKEGDSIRIPYDYSYDSSSGTGTGASKISVLITQGAYNEAGSSIKYYGQVADIASSGYVDIDLGSLSDFDESTDKVYILSETSNGAYKTDYASIPQSVSMDPGISPAVWIIAAVVILGVGFFVISRQKKAKAV